MSKKSLITREKILAKALEMFNERGVEYVGLRELAVLLGMRVGNITYYFPTKDDLVNQLSIDLNKLNSEILIVDKEITLISFLEMFKKASLIQLKYRGLVLSMVHLLTQNKVILARHQQTQIDRNIILTKNVDRLIEADYLKIDTEVRKGYLIQTIGLIARFWISEAAISFQQLSQEEQSNNYVLLIVNILSPYLTQKGADELVQCFEKSSFMPSPS
ncbi:TetR/AcrR family transcriptional regulator [Mucilaginibacter sp. HC2]|uniref:TetR/AcrR family transcriptional regulator n=1 Tax=Mucilaginibacter inviolabilis TaxID=2714892 RepID=UPI00140BB308|nr:TetR/AcrR family transcriptional regulator [Mucilaginibacter inviolabilis]NHA02483.1 TetR/AcrR family transcriptional regulator [Mucilaginibacter inviolabilis]